MSRSRSGRRLARRRAGLALLLLASLAPNRPARAEAGGLALEVQGPLFAGSPLVVEVTQSGALAGRRLAVQLAVDGVRVGRFEISGARTTLRAESARLAAGRHEVLAKSGTLRAAVTVRVWPRWLLYAAAGAPTAALLALFLGWRSRRRRRSVSGATGALG